MAALIKKVPLKKVLVLIRTLVLFYVLLYALLVLGSYGWLSTQSAVQLPRGAAFGFSTAQLGISLQAPQAEINIALAGPLELLDVQAVWPLWQPWQPRLRAERAQLVLLGDSLRDELSAVDVRLQVRPLLALSAQAASLDWRSMPKDTRGQSTSAGEAVDVTTFVAPKLDYEENWLNFISGGAPQALRFTASPIMLPTSALQAVVQMDRFNVALHANERLPRSTTRAAVAAWQQAGGQLSLTEFDISVIGINLLLAGDLRLNEALDLTGGMQLQISGIEDGYVRLGQMGIVPPQHYRLLGYLLQALPQAGQKTFTLPVKLEKNKMYIGPAAAINFGPMPWQAADALLATPVAQPQPLAEPQDLPSTNP